MEQAWSLIGEDAGVRPRAIMDMNYSLAKNFAEAVEDFRDNVAIETRTPDGTEVLTYGELGERVNGLAYFITSLGIKRSDRVGIILGNGPDWAVLFFALASVGAVAVPLDIHSCKEDVKKILSDSGTKVIFASRENQRVADPLKDYIRLILKRKWLIFGAFLLGVIIAGGLTFYFTLNEIKTYEANIWLEIGKIDKNILIESPEQLIEKIQEGIYGEFSYNVIVLNPTKTNLIQIKIEAIKPEEAQSVLEEISGKILAEHKERINVKKDFLRDGIIGPLDSFSNIQFTKIVKTPVISEKQTNKRPILNIIIGGLSGLFLGIFLVFLIEWWQAPRRDIY